MEVFSSVSEENCETSLSSFWPHTNHITPEYKIKGIFCDNFLGLKLGSAWNDSSFDVQLHTQNSIKMFTDNNINLGSMFT